MSISDAARSRLAERRATQAAAAEQQAAAERAAGGRPQIAVRFGPAPVRAETELPSEAARTGAGSLPRVGAVLEPSRPEPAAGTTAASAAPRANTSADDADAHSTPEVRVGLGGGSETERAREAARVAPEASRIVPSPRPQPTMRSTEPVQNAPLPVMGSAPERAAVRTEVEGRLAPEALQQAAAFAPAAPAPPIGSQEKSEASAPELLGSRDAPAGAAVARSSITQAGLVEAERADDPIARYLAQNPPRDAGPEPRVREELGVRSRPLSYYA